MQINIGDMVKCYDFHFRTDCYMIGEVTGFSGDYMEVRTTEVVFRGVADPKENMVESFRTPVMGAMMMDDMFNRIELVR